MRMTSFRRELEAVTVTEALFRLCVDVELRRK